MVATRTTLADEGAALQELFDKAVESICAQQKRDLNDAVSTLRVEIARLQEALNLTQATEHKGGDGDPCAAESAALQRRQVPSPLSSIAESGAKAGVPAPAAGASQRPHTPGDGAGPESPTESRRAVRFSRVSSDGRSKHGYSAAQIVELLSGGMGLYEEEKSSTCAASVLFVFVIISVLTSTVALGVSLDLYPDSLFWVALEAVCVLVFVVEFVAKLTVLEKHAYFCGPLFTAGALARRDSQNKLSNWKALHRRDKEAWINSFWNWLDFSITLVAVIDISITLSDPEKNQSFSMSMIRCFRFIRALRIVRLLRVPVVKDLMSIFFGLILGTPLLIGAFCLLMVTVYLAAIVFRMMFGPWRQVIEGCPLDESILDQEAYAKCPQHEYFADKYFGRMDTAMFTVFRCMTLDCSTVSGTSLIAVFSQGYGWPFDVAWAVLTIWVICGILNIIMASFVGKTTAELEVRESNFVQDRLRRLAKAVVDYAAIPISGVGTMASPRDVQFSWRQFEELFSSDSHHGRVVSGIVQELGMDISPQDLFHVLDLDESGSVDAVEFIDSLMMMSSIQKSGTVSTLIALHGLSSKMNDMNGNRPPNRQASDFMTHLFTEER